MFLKTIDLIDVSSLVVVLSLINVSSFYTLVLFSLKFQYPGK